MAARRLDYTIAYENNVLHTVIIEAKTDEKIFESVSLCEYARQFVDRSQLINNTLVSWLQ